MDNQRNLILAVVLCGILILGYEAAVTYYYPTPPETERRRRNSAWRRTRRKIPRSPLPR